MEEYSSEEEFLKSYDPSLYPPFGVTVDILLFGISSEDNSNYKKLDSKKMSVLLIKRDSYPYKDKWCIPGGFVDVYEDIDDAPRRILKRETGMDDIYLEQLYTFGSVNRDPRMRIVTTSYMALVDKSKYPDYSWFDIEEYYETKDYVEVTLSNGTDTIKFKVTKILKELTTDKYSYSVVKNDDLAFDNPLLIVTGYERLKNKIEYTDIVFNMMPNLFTLGELQKVYELILGKKLLDPAFRRIIADKVQKTDKFKTGEGHRPSRLFKYKNNI